MTNSRGIEQLRDYYPAMSQRATSGPYLVNDPHHNISAAAVGGDPGPLLLGSEWKTKDGRTYRYVQMTGGVALLGLLLQRAADVEEETVSSSDDLLSIEDGGITNSWTEGAFAGDWVYVDEGTGAQQCRRIVWNTDVTLFLDYPLVTALAIADSDIIIIRPYHMLIAAASRLTMVAGVAAIRNENTGTGPGTNAIDQNSYGWMQTKGFCDHVRMDDAAIAAGKALTVDGSNAGRAELVASNADFISDFVFGYAASQVETAADTGPVWLTNCLG